MTSINGRTRTCGLIGNPIEHTLSPLIHNYLAERMGQNIVYLPFFVEKEIQQAVEGCFSLNMLGMNVTVPYKQAVIPYLTELDENARKIGAVNTLVRQDKGFKGYNTDYLGLHRAMIEDGIDLKGRQVVILGAGGAAVSTAYLCAREQVEDLYILNRTPAKAEAIAKQVGSSFNQTRIIPMNLLDYKKLPNKPLTVIQTTSIGLYPNCEDTVIEDDSFYKKITQAVDLIFNPYETRFMKLVKRQGGQAYNGLKMLLYQGILAYGLWNNCEVPDELTREVYAFMQKELAKK